jgi:hypothetical protein
VKIMANEQQTTRETATERVFHAVRQAILYIALSGVSGAIAGILLTEGIGAALTRSLPGGPTHIAALAVGLLLGYAAAATATIWALVTGLAETIRALAGDVERAGQSVVHELEKLAGVRDHQSEASTVAPIVAGSVVTPSQPAVMSGLIVAASPALPPVVANSTQGGVKSTGVIAPLVPLTE